MPSAIASWLVRSPFVRSSTAAVVVCASAIWVSAQTIYVDDDALGEATGSDWPNAFTELQPALLRATAGSVIRVAGGVYRPDYDDSSGTHTGDRAASFILGPGVVVLGGYAGSQGPNPDDRDVDLHATVLSGDLAGNDAPANDPFFLMGDPNRAENSFHVVAVSGTGGVLDGLIIADGNGHGIDPLNQGAGVFIQTGSALLAGCTLRANTAEFGAGVYSTGGSPTMLRCRFSQNLAGNGGGMMVFNGSATLTECTFQQNSAEAGGGLYAESGNVALTSCRFLGNDARCPACIGGGAALAFSQVGAVNCAFSGNFAASNGGALKILGDGIELANCTIGDNWSTDEPVGGVSVNRPGPGGFVAINTILWGNTGNGGSLEQAQISAPAGTLNFCCVEGLSGDLGGTGNFGSDPLLVDPDGIDDEPGTDDDNLRLLDPSPCFNAALNAGLPSDAGDLDADDDTKEPVPLDLDGNPRVNSGIVDLGAFEVQRIPFADVAGSYSECHQDGFANLHDRNHILACFANTSPCAGEIFDAGGAFGSCEHDGFCNLFDVSHILTAFAGTNPCAQGPAPQVAPHSAGSVVLAAVANRDLVRPGGVVQVRVLIADISDDAPALQGYQLHLGVSPAPGSRGGFELQSITVEPRRDGAFAGAGDTDQAFSLGREQMFARVDGPGVPIVLQTYLATFTYQTTLDAAGTFVIDVRHDQPSGDQTFLAAGPFASVEVTATLPAVIRVADR